MKNEIKKYLSGKKTTVCFRDAGIPIGRIIDSALAHEKHPFFERDTIIVNDVLIRIAYCPSLQKYIAAFKSDNKSIRVYISDEFINASKAKEKIKNTTVHPLLKEINKRFYLKIPFELKDSLKKFIPSAKFCGEKKMWHVGSRSAQKLSVWVESNKVEIKSGNSSRAAQDELKAKRLTKKKMIAGAYHGKEMLKKEFDAEFGCDHNGNKGWFVDRDVYRDAIKAVNALETARAVTSQSIDKNGNLYPALETLNDISDDFYIFIKNKTYVPIGWSASYCHNKNFRNPEIVQLIRKTSEYIDTIKKSSKNNSLSGHINDNLLASLKALKCQSDINDTLFYVVLREICQNLGKAIIFADANDNKVYIWSDGCEPLKNLIAADILAYANLDAELEIDSGSY